MADFVQERRANFFAEAARIVVRLPPEILDEEPHGRRQRILLLEFLAVRPAGEEPEQVVVLVFGRRAVFERDQDVAELGADVGGEARQDVGGLRLRPVEPG